MCGCGGSGSAGGAAGPLLTGTLAAQYDVAPPPSDSVSSPDVIPYVTASAGGPSLVEFGLILAFLVAAAWAVEHALKRGKGE